MKIKREDYNNIWFTSDLHFFHKNILKFQKNRKFNTVDKMNDYIIKMWNNTVNDNDLVFILGDITFKDKGSRELMLELKGEKILVKGNHDHTIINNCKTIFKHFDDYIDLLIDNQRLVLCHYPIFEWRSIQQGKWIYGNYDLL